MKTSWNIDFLHGHDSSSDGALIILNQPFSYHLLYRLWYSTKWHCCADGGANRLYDCLSTNPHRELYIPNLIKGDLDSLRDDVREYYAAHGVPIIEDKDQDSTDLMKCVHALEEKERSESQGEQYQLLLLGGLTGRLDQTIHTLSYLHKLRKKRQRVFAVTDENVGWVLDVGEHCIDIDHRILGKTCGLLPVGIDETILTTRGLRWNLTEHPSSFDGLISTSNHLVPGESEVYIKTSKPIWWTVEVKNLELKQNGSRMNGE